MLPIFRSPKALFASRSLFKERKRCCFGTSQQRHLNSDASLPKEAEIVICGGGIVGCSVAYHLAKLGWRDVLLLEQGRYETEFIIHYLLVIIQAGGEILFVFFFLVLGILSHLCHL